MDFTEFLGRVLFSIGSTDFLVEHLLGILGALLFNFIAYRYITHRLLPRYFKKHPDQKNTIGRIKRMFFFIFLLVLIIAFFLISDLDKIVFANEAITIRISTILEAVLILQIARLLDWVISRLFIRSYYLKRDEEKSQSQPADAPRTDDTTGGSVQWAVYMFAIILILRSFEIDFTIWSYTVKDTSIDLKLSNIFAAILIVLLARLIYWVGTQIFLYSYYRRKEIDIGSQYAINQLLKYIIYIVAVVIAIENLGIHMTVVWGGLAALLVGLGLGLQQTFNDFFSGIILLFERSVEVGDVLELEGGLVGSVKKIGMRASLVETRQNLSVIVPNSRLVTQNVINWSHFDDKVRFVISVGVAYGSDTDLVKRLLIEIALENPYVIDFPLPFVRMINFGDSSLDFELHIWSKNFMVIEDVKSDIRFAIDNAFRKNQVQIPFPQRVVWNPPDQN